MELNIPRLLFTASRSGSGKTLLTCGFLEAVKGRGMEPVAFKCGPDYIDPMFHQYVMGIAGGNLDSFFLEEEQVREQLIHTMRSHRADFREKGAEKGSLAVIEGVMGYYDGIGGTSLRASTYDIARITQTPSVLILDCKGASLSLAAVVKGFKEFRKDSRIEGVLLNRLPASLYKPLAAAIEETGTAVFGYVPEIRELHLESRHLGLRMPEEVAQLKEKLRLLAGQMEQTVDIPGLLKLAGETKALFFSPERLTLPEEKVKNRVRIGVARDEAFCFYYQENLEQLKAQGAELVFFSPLRDAALPEGIDGLLLGGGYPENYGKELSANSSMLESVRAAHRRGLPMLAECGGFLYLHRRLEGSDGAWYEMAGLIEGEARYAGKLSRFGYITLTGAEGIAVKGHEFHYWDSTSPGEAWEAVKPSGGKDWRCMHMTGHLICGFPHLYYPSAPEFVSGWLSQCENYKKNESQEFKRERVRE